MAKNPFGFPRFPTGFRNFVIPCPKCGKENTFAFAKVKKLLKPRSKPPIVADCGCSLTPNEIAYLFEDKAGRDLGWPEPKVEE